MTTTLRQRQIDAILRRNGGRVPVRPARVAGAGEDDIGPVVFGPGSESITPECAERVRAIGDRKFDPARLLADIDAIAEWHHMAATLHFERTGEGDGFSVICEVHPLGAKRTGFVHCRETIAGVPRDVPASDLSLPTAKSVELTLTYDSY